jgi:hypothetical protein
MRDPGTNRPLDTRGVTLLVVAVAVIYAILWFVGRELLADVYTPEWTARRIPLLFAPVTLLVAVLSRRVLATALSLGGYVVGVLVGELVGAPVLAGRTARLEQELAAGIEQSWQPTHPGWWIATLVFLLATGAGVVLAWRDGRAAGITAGRSAP